MPSRLAEIERKVLASERLSAAEGEYLYQPQVDLHAIGRLADEVRRRKNGDIVSYNINAHLNPTNICLYRCPLCAYSCDPGDPRAFLMTDQEVLAVGREAAENGCTELHIVGGVHPEKNFAWHRDLLARLHEAFPRLMLKAWTAVEIARFAHQSGRSLESILEYQALLDLSGPLGAQLIFRQSGSLPTTDLITIEVSLNGGATWVPIDQQIGIETDWEQRIPPLGEEQIECDEDRGMLGGQSVDAADRAGLTKVGHLPFQRLDEIQRFQGGLEVGFVLPRIEEQFELCGHCRPGDVDHVGPAERALHGVKLRDDPVSHIRYGIGSRFASEKIASCALAGHGRKNSGFE